MFRSIFLLKILFLIFFVGIFIIDICTQKKSSIVQEEKKISIVASFYPLAEFVSRVGGEFVEVTTLISTGVEPHDYELTPSDIINLYKSDLIFFNGGGLEPWGENLISDIRLNGGTVLVMSDHIQLRENLFDTHEDDSDNDDFYDPHIWLDPILAQREVNLIIDTLSSYDPNRKNYYHENGERFLRELRDLDQEYKQGLVSCEHRELIVSHAAFGYLSDRYDISMVPISGLSPDEEPSPKRMAEVIDFARKKNITHIFFETLVSPKLADTIAKEIGAKSFVLNPLEGLTSEELNDGKNYITIMRENLFSIREAMICQ